MIRQATNRDQQVKFKHGLVYAPAAVLGWGAWCTGALARDATRHKAGSSVNYVRGEVVHTATEPLLKALGPWAGLLDGAAE
jgi:hypothetical protein